MVDLVEPAAGAHASTSMLDKLGACGASATWAATSLTRQPSHSDGESPLLDGESFQQSCKAQALLLDYPPTGFGVHRSNISQVS